MILYVDVFVFCFGRGRQTDRKIEAERKRKTDVVTGRQDKANRQEDR